MSKVTITIAEYRQHRNNDDGICLACEEWTVGGCEPDACGYACELCGEDEVYGVEEAQMTNRSEVED